MILKFFLNLLEKIAKFFVGENDKHLSFPDIELKVEPKHNAIELSWKIKNGQ